MKSLRILGILLLLSQAINSSGQTDNKRPPFDWSGLLNTTVPIFIQKCSYYLIPGDSVDRNRVCIDYKDFSGFSPYDIPFVGVAGENIKEIYVNNKKISIGKDGSIFFRQSVNLSMGYNRIPIRMMTRNGIKQEAFIEITIVQDSQSPVNITIQH